MFWSSPSLDIKISLGLLLLSVIISLIILAISKKRFLSVAILSVLGNFSFLINIYSRMFITYNLEWLQIFSLLVWPIFNIYLIVKYFQRKK